MNTLRKVALAILDKMDQLLTSEPARLIGYGAAVVVVLTVKAVEFVKPGLLPQVSFDEAVGMAFTASATVVILVESIRRFVYSPLTYIEDLSDESHAAHEAAHLEEETQRFFDRLRERVAEESQPTTTTVGVGSVRAKGSTDKAN